MTDMTATQILAQIELLKLQLRTKTMTVCVFDAYGTYDRIIDRILEQFNTRCIECNWKAMEGYHGYSRIFIFENTEANRQLVMHFDALSCVN